MDELVLLDEDKATRSFLDSLNCRALFRLLWFFGFVTAISAAAALAQQQYWQLALAATVLVVIRALYALRYRPTLSLHFRPALLGYLTLQLVQLRMLPATAEMTPLDLLLPLVLLFFRLPWYLSAVPLTALWAVSSGNHLIAFAIAEEEPWLWVVAGQSLIALVVAALGNRLFDARRRAFVADWRRESRRHRERSRMREELGDARKIQLSMLPRSDPKIPWLDVAGISIPASEVGGDYYDYFTVSESRQAVVVADVAGHGVASGLLLSGIRSCLHLLLQDSPPPEPAEILSRLDRMVRETTTRHFFVTLLYALFDVERGTVTLASAGHPPLLHFRAAEQDVDELALPSLPLGTGLTGSRQQRTTTFTPEDIFLLYSDGIAETVDNRLRVYGYERLIHRLQATAHDRSAVEIRNTLLEDIVSFKGDGEQTDDITLVVVKAQWT